VSGYDRDGGRGAGCSLQQPPDPRQNFRALRVQRENLVHNLQRLAQCRFLSLVRILHRQVPVRAVDRVGVHAPGIVAVGEISWGPPISTSDAGDR
jgi:hypothetical protein